MVSYGGIRFKSCRFNMKGAITRETMGVVMRRIDDDDNDDDGGERCIANRHMAWVGVTI